MDVDDLGMFVLLLNFDGEEDEIEDERQRQGMAASVLAGIEEWRELKQEHRAAKRLYLVRADLLPNPRAETSWAALRDGRNNRACMTTMGSDWSTFDAILDTGFSEIWCHFVIPRNDVSSHGAPRVHRRSLDADGALALTLHFLNSTMREITLQQLFALIPTTVSRYINYGLQILELTLSRMHDARVIWPNGPEGHQELASLIEARHPLLVGAFAFIDGLKLPTCAPDDPELENALYNGWLHSHFYTSVIAFSPKGMYT
jgi:hypothetical protein